GGVRQPRRPGGVGGHPHLLALPQRPQGRAIPPHPVHHLDAGRPRPPRPRSPDGGEDAGNGPRRAVLREHGGRPRRRRGAPPGGFPVRPGAHVPLGPAASAVETTPHPRGGTAATFSEVAAATVPFSSPVSFGGNMNPVMLHSTQSGPGAARNG